MTRTISAARIQALHEALMPIVSQSGYDLDELTIAPMGRTWLMQIIVDADSPITSDDITVISHQISQALDDGLAHGVLGDQPYTLEVSTPGVSRPVTTPVHWRRAQGRLVTVTIDQPESPSGAATSQEITARVGDVNELGVTLHDETPGNLPCTYPYTALGPGRINIEFNRPDSSDNS